MPFSGRAPKAMAHLCRIIMCDVLAFCPHNPCDYKRELVDGIDGPHEDRPIPRLLSALHGIEIDERDFPTLDSHHNVSKPSDSTTANSSSILWISHWISGSAAIVS